MDTKKLKTANQESFRKDMWELMKDGKHSDCRLIADGKIFDVHSILLVAASKYFETVLEFSAEQQRNPIIIFESFGADDLELVLSYIYKGEVDVEANKLKDFLAILKFLKIANPVEVPHEKVQVHKVKATRSDFSLSKSNYSNDPPKARSNERKSLPILKEVDSDSRVKVKDKFQGKASSTSHKRSLSPDYETDNKESSDEFFVPDKKAKRAHRKPGPGDEDLITIANLLKSAPEVKKSETKLTKNPVVKDSKSFSCQFCGNKFKLDRSRKTHEKSCKENPSREIIICTLCNQEFTRKDTLRNHLARVHKVHEPQGEVSV